MLRVMIIEDEKHSRETLRNLLTEFVAGVEIVAMAGEVQEAIFPCPPNPPGCVVPGC
jgi:two-component system, LytTR family, response regulator